MAEYHDSIPDMIADLGGDIADIRNLFTGFQRYLYRGVDWHNLRVGSNDYFSLCRYLPKNLLVTSRVAA